MATASLRADIQNRKVTSPSGKIRVEDWQDFAESVVFATSEVADGGVAHFMDTDVAFASGKLLSLRNNGSERSYFRYDGSLFVYQAGGITFDAGVNVVHAYHYGNGLAFSGNGGAGYDAGNIQVLVRNGLWIREGTSVLFASDIASLASDTSLQRYGDGKIRLAGTTPMFALGGTTSSFPAIKRTSDFVDFRKADDSDYAGIRFGGGPSGDANSYYAEWVASGFHSSGGQFGGKLRIKNATAGGNLDLGVGDGGTPSVSSSGLLSISAGGAGQIWFRSSYLTLDELAAPSAPGANSLIIYAVDNGGKTELLVRFASGAAQQLAIEL